MLTQIFKLLFDASAVDRGLAEVSKTAKKAGESVASSLAGKIGKAAGALFAVGAVVNFVNSIREAVDKIKDLSDQLELSTDEVQRLQVGADRAAVNIGTVATALAKIEDLRTAAQTGDKKAMGIFAALGIDPSKGSNLDILKQAVDASGKGLTQQAALFDLVGKKAALLRNVVMELNNMEPLDIIDRDAIKSIDDFNNAFKDLSREAKAAAAESAAPFFAMVARIISRGRQLDREGKSFALSRAILEESYGKGPPEADTSPLPLPLKEPKGSGQAQAMARAAIPLGIAGDSLSRIGLFVGGRGGASERLVSIASSQLAAARTTNRLLAEMRDNQ